MFVQRKEEIEKKWKSFTSTKWPAVILLAVELLLLVIAGVKYSNHVSNLITIHYTDEMIRSFTPEMSEACFGGTLTEDYEAGLYDAIPELPLRKGYYRYTVTYTAHSPGSFCWPHSYEDYYNLLDQAVTYFQNDTNTDTNALWLNASVPLALRVSYTGEGEVTITDFEIRETKAQANLELFSTILWLAAVDLALYLVWRRKNRPIPGEVKFVFLALLAIAAIASYPLLTGYCIDGHDFRFHLTRLAGLAEGLRSGQFPVRINPTFYNGYGYANPIFYGEILMYLPALLHIIGFRLTTCYLIYVGIINLLTTFVSYYSFEKMLKDRVLAVGCTLLYVLAPYHVMDLYLRAAMGEYSAMAFLPLVVYGIHRIFTEDFAENTRESRWCFLPLTIGLTGIVQTHVLTGEIVCGVMFMALIFMIGKTLRPKRLLALLKAAGATILINLWFLVPFIDYSLTQDIRILQATKIIRLQKTGTYITQLFALFTEYHWDTADGLTGIGEDMPYAVGLPLGLGLLIFLGMLVGTAGYREEKKRGGMLLLLSVITLWMATFYFPWDRIASMHPLFEKLISSLQFAWRMLTPAVALAAACTGFGLLILRREKGAHASYVVMGLLAGLTIVASTYFMQQCLQLQPPIVWNTIENLDWNTQVTASGGEYVLCSASYEDVTEHFTPRAFEGVEVTDYTKSGTNMTLTVEGGATDGYVLLPLLAYKGYTLTSDDGRLDSSALVEGDHAVLRVNVPAGYTGTLHIRFSGMWYWRVAELVSLLSVLLPVIFAHRSGKKEKVKETQNEEPLPNAK